MAHSNSTPAAMILMTVLVPVLMAGSLPGQEKPPTPKPPPVPEPILELVEVDESSINRISRSLPLGDAAEAIDGAWLRKDHAAVAALADAIIEADGASHAGYALRYLAAVELAKDRALARKVAVEAIKKLGRDARAMADFVNKALYVEAQVPDYQLALMALTPLVPDGRKIAAVRIAHLRALMGCGKVREALVTNRKIIEDLGETPEDLLDLASAICDMEGGRSLGAMARKAFDKGRSSRPEDQELRMLEYRIFHDLEGNKKAAKELGLKIINEAAATSGSLNNWVWYLMTLRTTAGKYPSLALLGARVMQRSESLTYGNMDTVALALFKNGLIDEAVALQARAVELGGGNASDGIRRRLAIYRAAQRKNQTKNQTRDDKAPQSAGEDATRKRDRDE